MISWLEEPIGKLIEIQDDAYHEAPSSLIVHDRLDGGKSPTGNRLEVQLWMSAK